MELTPDSYDGTYIITGYEADAVLINQKAYQATLILGRDTLLTTGLPSQFKDIDETHIEMLIQLQPKLIIIGSGQSIKQLPPQYAAQLNQNGIGVEVMDTIAACRTLSLLLSEDRNAYTMLFFEK